MDKEQKLAIYNEIDKYNEFADAIIEKIEDAVMNDDLLPEEKELLPLAKKLKSTAEFLIEKYIKFLNEDESVSSDEIREVIDDINEQIDFCKNHIHEIYLKKEAN